MAAVRALSSTFPLARAARLGVARLASPNRLSFASNPRFASTLVIADHNNKELNVSTLSAITAATKIGGDITVLAAGSGFDAVCDTISKVKGVTKVLKADADIFAHTLAEDMESTILACQVCPPPDPRPAGHKSSCQLLEYACHACHC
eukprot:2609577-Rhodomonas_salina.3